ncbi:3'(2'),5'-bisphosphate nucleotidase CysQ [Metallibacterium sp.]|uniref:3'(2'),5'-bisphosphate nucleotidase CysQ n=1 Tax=Metallibacterium sp. TaxID=2940281 RepID=UPI00262E07AD|nr:3'(2'),5'-bisphosphate nucleotidase CysQ [Metallibacterium sp.]
MTDLDLARAVGACTRDAGKAILEIYAGSFSVQHKADTSPLTAADLAAQRVLLEGLARLAPGVPVLSEEAAAAPWSRRQTWARYWLVDPLDGTREFVKRNGEFTVNVALIEDHHSVLGVVHAPVGGELAWAVAGEGAWLQSVATRMPQPLCARVAPERPVLACSRSHGSVEEQHMLARLGPHERLPLGSSLKFLRLASGAADVYLRVGPTSEWDTAAAQCILEQAGGAVLDLQGHALSYNRKDSLLNPSFIAVADPARDWLRQLGITKDSHTHE